VSEQLPLMVKVCLPARLIPGYIIDDDITAAIAFAESHIKETFVAIPLRRIFSSDMRSVARPVVDYAVPEIIVIIRLREARTDESNSEDYGDELCDRAFQVGLTTNHRSLCVALAEATDHAKSVS